LSVALGPSACEEASLGSNEKMMKKTPRRRNALRAILAIE